MHPSDLAVLGGNSLMYRGKNWFRDARVSLFLLCWALIASALCMYNSKAVNSGTLTTNKDCPYKFAGGDPSQSHGGSCWCGKDGYCLCTPSLAIDAIIEVPGPMDSNGKKTLPSVVLVHRRDPPVKYAIPGGFVNVGETVEDAAAREVREETNLEIKSMQQFHVYSAPDRDPRRHTVSSVFRCIVHSISTLRARDDARSAKAWRLDELKNLDLAFDHKQILVDYIKRYHHELLPLTGLIDSAA